MDIRDKKYDEQASSDIPEIRPGDIVRAIAGPYENYDVYIFSIDHSKQTAEAALAVFGGPPPFEIHLSMLRKIPELRQQS